MMSREQAHAVLRMPGTVIIYCLKA